MSKLHLLVLLCGALLPLAASAKSEEEAKLSADPQPTGQVELTEWEFDGFAPLPEVPEPSGLCFHPERNSLFIVDDGDTERPAGVYELDLHADVLASRQLGDDLEGICYCSYDGLLYVADEADERVYAVDPASLELIREFQISRNFAGEEVLVQGGNGLEGIEYIPPSADGSDGDFFVLLNQDDPHMLVRVNRSDTLQATDGPVPLAAIFPLAKINTGELHYNASRHELWVVHSWMNVIEVLTVPSMAVLRWEVLPGAAQEAVTVDGEGRLWIGYDLGGIARYRKGIADEATKRQSAH